MALALDASVGLYPFVLTEDQEHLRREIREFAAREITPNIMVWDEASEFPLAVVKKLGAMGLLGIIFPSEYGGAGLGYLDYALAIEELSAVDGSLGLTVAAHNSLGTNHIFRRQRATKEKVRAFASQRRMAGCLGAHRARLGFRCCRRQNYRGAKGRSLCAERKQDVHHQRTLC